MKCSLIIKLVLAWWTAALLLSSSAWASVEPPRMALVIGNSKYGGGDILHNPRNDAKAISKTLKDLGFEVKLHHDLNFRGMKKAVSKFQTKLRKTGAVGLFYYAGHAAEVEGENYLLPIGYSGSESDLEFDAFNLQRVIKNMQDARDGLNILMVDACRNNPWRGFGGTRSLGRTRGVSEMSDIPLGTFISASTAKGKVAADGFGDHSPYTTAVLKHIKEPGLTIEQVFKRVRVDVVTSTGRVQKPWESSSLTTDFYFAGQDDGQSLNQIAEAKATQKQIAEAEAAAQNQIAEAEAAQIKIREEARRANEESEKLIASLKLKLDQAERENAKAKKTQKTNKTEEQSPVVEVLTRADIEREVNRLREEEKALIARREAQHNSLLDICDSMAKRHTTSPKTFQCYENFLAKEDANSGRAIRGLSDLKDNVINALNVALENRKLTSAKRNFKMLAQLSPTLVPSYEEKLNVLESDIKAARAETRKKVKVVPSF